MSIHRIVLVALGALTTTLAHTVAVQPNDGHLPAFGDATLTPANRGFCASLPDECRLNLAERATIDDTPDNRMLLDQINTLVNSTIDQVSDIDHWGVSDRWDFAEDGRGDCEDMQLLKRRLLVDAGLPKRALRLLVVTQPNGDGHMVLVARLSTGDVILDNLSYVVLPWRAVTEYTFIKIERTDRQGWGWIRPQP